jgi:Anti-sigma factor NepR
MGGLIPAGVCVNVSRGQQKRRMAEARHCRGDPMSDGDEKPPGKVIPFARAIQGAIAEDLRKMYAELLREKLPDDISELMKQFGELAKKEAEPEK